LGAHLESFENVYRAAIRYQVVSFIKHWKRLLSTAAIFAIFISGCGLQGKEEYARYAVSQKELVVLLSVKRVSLAPPFGVHPIFQVYDLSRDTWESWAIGRMGEDDHTELTRVSKVSNKQGKTLFQRTRKDEGWGCIKRSSTTIDEERKLSQYLRNNIGSHYYLEGIVGKPFGKELHELLEKRIAEEGAYVYTHKETNKQGDILNQGTFDIPKSLLKSIKKKPRTIERSPRNDKYQVLFEWRGEEAKYILEVLRKPNDYPHKLKYSFFFGPNSNTYVAWVLRRARVSADLHPLMAGKDYLGWHGFGMWYTNTFSGIQIESPLVGVKVGLLDGAEVHLGIFTLFGIDLWPPAFKTPLGRFGFAE